VYLAELGLAALYGLGCVRRVAGLGCVVLAWAGWFGLVLAGWLGCAGMGWAACASLYRLGCTEPGSPGCVGSAELAELLGLE